MDRSIFRDALRGLRTDAVRAHRKRDPKLMIAIGLADPEQAAAMEDEGLEDEGPPLAPDEEDEELEEIA